MAQGNLSQIARRSLVSSDGVQLSYLEAGWEHADNWKICIALIPGWSMPATIWRHQLAEFGRSYHTLALDPRGQGASQVPSREFTVERRAEDIKDLLDRFSNVLLIGWSLGAIESLQYIHMFGASRLVGLVLVDSSVGEEPAPPPSTSFLQELRENRDRALAGFVRAIFKSPQSEDEFADLVEGAKRMSLDQSIALLSNPFPRSHWKSIVHGCTKPLLYVVTPQFEAQASNLQKNRPGSGVEVFREAGHALFVDEADRFNALIGGFAESLLGCQ